MPQLNPLQYGTFQTPSTFLQIQTPIPATAQIFLMETETFLITTQLQYFKNFLASNVKANNITPEYKVYCLENVEHLSNGIFSFTTSLFHDEMMLKRFAKLAIKGADCFIWDKQRNTYATEIEQYQIDDHPFPCVGTKKEYYAVNGKECYSFNMIIY
jgi:hypothetical protein